MHCGIYASSLLPDLDESDFLSLLSILEKNKAKASKETTKIKNYIHKSKLYLQQYTMQYSTAQK